MVQSLVHNFKSFTACQVLTLAPYLDLNPAGEGAWLDYCFGKSWRDLTAISNDSDMVYCKAGAETPRRATRQIYGSIMLVFRGNSNNLISWRRTDVRFICPLPLKLLDEPGVTSFEGDIQRDQGQRVIGFCCSVMKYHDPKYSGIPNDTPPEEVAPELIKTLWIGGSIKKYTTGSFPVSLNPSARIPADVWDSTPSMTNTNKVQYHLTNSLTGIKLPPEEALERRVNYHKSLFIAEYYTVHKVDMNITREIQMSLQTGILSNSSSENSPLAWLAKVNAKLPLHA
ncbi:hypothetical protein B0H11DRAFT_2197634 [Mycena galericulata]|nr:hypothetical protein B0H11DRAFT_2197634 [Mycena galericulata]